MKENDSRPNSTDFGGRRERIYRAREQISEMGSHACLAENWGFSHRRGNHARCFFEGLQEVIDPKTPREFSRMALCHRHTPLHDVAPKEAATDNILGCDAHSRVRGIVL